MKAAAMAYIVVEERKGVLIRFYETMSADDVRQSLMEIWTLPRWRFFRYEICDLRDLTAGTLNETEVKMFAHLDNAATIGARRMKLAFVATQPEAVEKCNDYLEVTQSEGLVVRVFDTMDQARAWAET